MKVLDLRGAQKWRAGELRVFECPRCKKLRGHIDFLPGEVSAFGTFPKGEVFLVVPEYESLSGATWIRSEVPGLAWGGSTILHARDVQLVPSELAGLAGGSVLVSARYFWGARKFEWTLIGMNLPFPEGSAQRYCPACKRYAGRILGVQGHLEIHFLPPEEEALFPAGEVANTVYNHAVFHCGEVLRLRVVGSYRGLVALSMASLVQGEMIRVESPDHEAVEVEVPGDGYLHLSHPEPRDGID